jgi:hypothetical protein
MVYEVEMWAFMEGAVRKVTIEGKTDLYADELVPQLLEEIFYWGQNEVQPLEMPSVSVGDVARMGDDRWLCCSVGWKKLTHEEYVAYTRMSQVERVLSSLRHQ